MRQDGQHTHRTQDQSLLYRGVSTGTPRIPLAPSRAVAREDWVDELRVVAANGVDLDPDLGWISQLPPPPRCFGHT